MRNFSLSTLTAKKGNFHRSTLEEMHICDGVGLTITPVMVREGEGWLGEALVEVGRHIDLEFV